MATRPETATIPLPTTLARAPFGEWTYQQADEALRKLLPDVHEVRRTYAVDRNHWASGNEWVGPGNTATNDRIEQQFAPDDVIGEALDNIGNAFSEPQVTLEPIEEVPEGEEVPDAIAAKLAEAEGMLFSWWDSQRAHEQVMDRVHTSAWAGRAALRLWAPGRFLQRTNDGVRFLPTREIGTAFGYIHLSAPDPATCGIVVHAATQDRCAIFLDEEEIAEPSGATRSVKRAELTYLDPNAAPGQDAATIVRVVYSDASVDGYEARLDLNSRLLTAEMSAPSLLTDPVLRTTRQLNFLTSLLTRMTETAAFRERYVKNAKPVGARSLWEEGDSVPEGAFIEKDETNRLWLVVPNERTLGSNTTTELVGLPTYGANGEPTGYATPDVIVFDPVDPTPYVQTAAAVRGRILRMCKQGHLAGSGTGEASGLAYEQARAAFGKDLNRRRMAEEGMLRELLTAVLSLAEWIANQPGYFTDYIRVAVDQHVDAGPRSPESTRVDMEAADKGLLSKETAMSRMGVEDPGAEQDRLDRDPGAMVGRWKEVAEVLAKLLPTEAISTETAVLMLVDAGLPIDDAQAEVRLIREGAAPPVGSPGSGFGNEGIVIPGLEAA